MYFLGFEHAHLVDLMSYLGAHGRSLGGLGDPQGLQRWLWGSPEDPEGKGSAPWGSQGGSQK